MEEKPLRFGYRISETDDKDIVLTPEGEHKYTVIWMHGLGDSAEGFLDFFYSPDPIV